ncbi:MAG TPA: cation-transporting P-type ATPase [Candidatus Saccharimonadales bacterium]|nr:cation-transporting P-type ATPase [Candidatus Saccharimonadales bacterium]
MTNERHIYNLEIEESLKAFSTSAQGLSADEAARRLAEYGSNAIVTQKEPFFKRLIEPFANAFVIVLLFALVLSMFEGKALDASIIGVIVGINAIIYYFQQYSVGRVLKTLKQQDVSYVNVLRGGATVRVPSEQLTYGDVIHVEEGVKVPADGRLIQSNQVEADEALLTGESLPVHKHAAAIAGEKQVYDQHNMLFKGTYVRGGTGRLMVTGIGNDTQLGGITTLAAQADMGRSPIERKIDVFTKRLIVVILFAAVLALGLSLWRGIEVEEALRFSLVIMVSAVPEGLPVALTIVLLLSARRMAKVKALVKKISSIETMGAVTVIATDKTGTITQNKLSVADKHTTHGSLRTFDEVIRVGLNGEGDHAGDSLDAILRASVSAVEIPSSWRKVKEFPFNQELRLSGVLWQHGNGFSLYIKGAPEHILSHCGQHHRADARTEAALKAFTGRGYRTIAFAHKDLAVAPAALGPDVLSDMDFDGFVGMADELRPKVAQAVAEAHRAGIKVVMLTGDHVATAGFIARQVGIVATDAEVSDSGVLAGENADSIRTALQTVRVFGRVLPEHKYALLKATKDYEITAMTGDGVNDIPALVEADAGIAMGSGTDAAKDASDIVLMDNNFHTIVAAVRVGRTALANIRKMLMYLLGTSGGEVLTMILALIIGLPLPVVAIQILWINLVTDGVSVIPLGLSPAEPRQMHQPPRLPNAPLLNLRQITRILVMASVMSLTVLWIFDRNLDKGLLYAQTLAFLSLIVIQWANAFNINVEYRSWIYNFIRPNFKLWAAIGFSIWLQVAVFMTPFGSFLHVEPVMWRDALLAIVVPVAVMLTAVDLHKLIWHLANKKRNHYKALSRR